MAIRLPGVVVRIVPDIGRPALPAFPRYVCIIAQGEHRLKVRNEAIVRRSDVDYDYFQHYPVEEVILVGNSPDRGDYRLTDHYILYSEGGIVRGIQWNPLTAAVLGPGPAEPFAFSVDSYLRLSLDGYQQVTVTFTSAGSPYTAAQVVSLINTALSAAYGSEYGNVATVVDGTKVKLTSVKKGEDFGVIRIYGGSNDASEIIFGDLDGDGDTNGLADGIVETYFGTGRRPDAGNTFFVTYRYKAPDSTYEPQLYFDLEPIMRDHGELFLGDPTGKLNSLVAMAKVAFQNHPERIPGLVVLQLDLRNAVDPYNPTTFELKNAFLNAIAMLDRVTEGKLYLVADSTDPDVVRALINHAIYMSNPEVKAERMVVTSLPEGSGVNDYVSAGPSYFSERVMLFYPSRIGVSIDGQSFKLAGYYSGLVYAARKTAVPVGTPINLEPLQNLDLVDRPLTYNEKKALLAAGVAVVDMYNGRVVILHGITTRTDFVVFEEENVIDIADYVKAIWRQRLESVFLNKPITSATLGSMILFSRTVLDSLIRDRIVSGYKDLSAVQDEMEPRLVRIRGRIKPMYHALYIDVEFVFATVL
jgi:hypothetical protein